jgi:Flp pilus assembly protein TadB
MGKASREKWLRRIEEARLLAKPAPSRLQTHVPWLAPTVFAVVLAFAGGWGLDMTPFYLLIAALAAACLLALWFLSEKEKHQKLRIIGTVGISLLAVVASFWNYKYK